MDEERFVELLNKKDYKTIKLFNNKYAKLLKQYCYIGGMPEVVSNFVENKDFMSVRELQNEILAAYEEDFTKHIPENTVVPVEVKAETNLQAKSLKVYMEKFKPELAIRTSLADYKKTENLVDIPLYAIEHLNNF